MYAPGKAGGGGVRPRGAYAAPSASGRHHCHHQRLLVRGVGPRRDAVTVRTVFDLGPSVKTAIGLVAERW